LKPRQDELFSAPALPEGFVYAERFLAAPEEAELLEKLAALPFEEARYREYTARRRIVMYEPEVPPLLQPLRARVAAWMGIDPAELRHALINEFRPGTPLGWHRDAPQYGRVAGVSLGGWARMRLRKYPRQRDKPLVLELAPRSAYSMDGPARWHWQHSISATRELRYSITFRTLRQGD
jgi:alkylated DNA repair dioxygenase AlkB